MESPYDNFTCLMPRCGGRRRLALNELQSAGCDGSATRLVL